VSGKNLSDTIFKTNLEASQTIARQLRLRNLGGIIIIDFIDMDTDEQRETVLEELKKAVDLDRARTNVNGFTQLGLVEMTRKRTRESLAHLLCEPCQVCSGRGEHKTAQTICYEIMRELLRESKQFNAKEFKVIASSDVIELLQDEESQSLANLADFMDKRVTLQSDTQYAREAFDIVWF
jgi:ribonuclease G